jgi:hypothetical protein
MKTMVRYDIYNDFKDEHSVAYCYQGQYVGALAFYNGISVIIFLPQGYLLDQNEVQKSINNSANQFNNFELWSYVHEIEDEGILQQALNRLYNVYCNFYPTMDFMRGATFKGFNEVIVEE